MNPIESPEDATATAADGASRPRIGRFYAIGATLLSVAVGGAITVIGTVVVLEAFHTKDGSVTLIVLCSTIAAGGMTAIALRRRIMKP